MPQLKNICKYVKGFSFKNTKNTENSAIRKQTTHQKREKKKRAKDLNRCLTKEDGKSAFAKMLIFICHREVHDTTVRYHTHLSGWLESRTLAHQMLVNMQHNRHHHSCWLGVQMAQALQQNSWLSLPKLNIVLPYHTIQQSYLFLICNIYLGKKKSPKQKICTHSINT